MGGWFDLDLMEREDEIGGRATALSASYLHVFVRSFQNEPLAVRPSVLTGQRSQRFCCLNRRRNSFCAWLIVGFDLF